MSAKGFVEISASARCQDCTWEHSISRKVLSDRESMALLRARGEINRAVSKHERETGHQVIRF